MRYTLYIFIGKDKLEIPLKRKQEADSWIDDTVGKAVLKDNTNGKETILKAA